MCNTINKNLWGTHFSYVCKTQDCEEQPHFHAFADNGYFMIMPLYPIHENEQDTCSLNVIIGSHIRKSNTISKKHMKENSCCLNLKVGEIFIGHANLLHRDGAAAKTVYLLGTERDSNLQRKAGPIANMSLYANLFDCGKITNDDMKKDIAEKSANIKEDMITITCND